MLELLCGAHRVTCARTLEGAQVRSPLAVIGAGPWRGAPQRRAASASSSELLSREHYPYGDPWAVLLGSVCPFFALVADVTWDVRPAIGVEVLYPH